MEKTLGYETQYDFDIPVNRRGTMSIKYDGAEKNGMPKDILPLWIADMDFKNAPEIIEGLKEYMDSIVFGYTGPTDAYYDAVIGWMQRRHGFIPKREWFVLTPGVVPAVNDMVGAFTKPGDSVLITPPVYYPFRNAIEGNKRNVVESELISNNGTYSIDFDDFEKEMHLCERFTEYIKVFGMMSTKYLIIPSSAFTEV